MNARALAAVALAALLLVILMLPLRDGFTDDGYIHIQYANNIINRAEYSFNPGETSFGTTSPLWVLVLAAIGMFFENKEALITLSRVLSWIAGLCAVGGVFVLTRRLGAGLWVAAMATVTFAADAWLVRWTALSMESSTAALAVVLLAIAATRASRDRRSAAALGSMLALASLVRPEVYLFFPVYAAWVLSEWRRIDKQCVLATVGVSAALLVPWLLFAHFHIGSLLPNTAGAKSGGLVMDPLTFIRKFEPIVKILGSTQGIPALAMLVGLVVRRRHSVVVSQRGKLIALWSAALPVAYVLFDIQVLSRYLLLISPLVCALGFVSMQELIGDRVSDARRRLLVGAAALITATVSVALYFTVVLPPSQRFTHDLQHNMRALAEHLREISPPDAVVAAADIGYLAFYSERRVLDLGGLVEPETGKLRARFDYEEIVARGLYLDVPGYPHVDYLVDRELVADRFVGTELAGHRFQKVFGTTVRDLGIRKPGPFYYTLYRITPTQ